MRRAAQSFHSITGILHSPKQTDFSRLPITEPGARLERRDFKKPALVADPMLGAPQPASQFVIVHGSEKLNFARGPAARRGKQADAAPFALGDDFLDGAARAVEFPSINPQLSTLNFPSSTTNSFRTR